MKTRRIKESLENNNVLGLRYVLRLSTSRSDVCNEEDAMPKRVEVTENAGGARGDATGQRLKEKELVWSDGTKATLTLRGRKRGRWRLVMGRVELFTCTSLL